MALSQKHQLSQTPVQITHPWMPFHSHLKTHRVVSPDALPWRPSIWPPGQPSLHQPERDPRWSMQELAVMSTYRGFGRKKKSTYSPLQKVDMNVFGHADFEKINLKMILSIFDGPNSGQKNANHFFLDLTAARHISGIFGPLIWH